MTSWRRMTTDTHQARLNGSAPRCDHADALSPVEPRSAGCPPCERAATAWAGLLVCLTCGWVACSDDSTGRHAREHYEETDHPVAARLEPGSAWRWCYIHARPV